MATVGTHSRFEVTRQDLFQDRREALAKLPKDALVELVLRHEIHLEGTAALGQPTCTRPFDMPWEPREFVRLPEDSDEGSASRRVSLVSFDLAHPIIGLELCGDVVIGRGTEADLDLTDCNAIEYGVSRRHAMLLVVGEEFQLVDLKSSNGTSCNNTRLKPGVPHCIQHNDILDFGRLQFQFRLID